MEIAELCRPTADRKRYSWTVMLPRPGGQDVALRPDVLNASEQMFFFGAPLAHVVQYEEHLKALRHEKAARLAARGRRPAPPMLTALTSTPTRDSRSHANGD